MPYRRHAKARITVDSPCRVKVTLVYKRLTSFSKDLCYLHVHHERNYPTRPGRRFTWLDVGGRGHFAGIYLRAAGPSLSDTSNGTIYWTGCLEGDEVFEADGETVEHGTGTEDYFNAGWNGVHGKLDHAQVLPLHGYTIYDAARDSSRTAAFRWRLPSDVVPFTRHFKASIEAGPQDDVTGNYESIAYYYLQEP
jgi:hypothetical protein